MGAFQRGQDGRRATSGTVPVTATTPHGLAADRLVQQGPVDRETLLRHIATFVPKGQAAQVAMRRRRSRREREGFATKNLPDSEVLASRRNLSVPLEIQGARVVARDLLTQRLTRGTFIVNDDGLIQHRDWKPE